MTKQRTQNTSIGDASTDTPSAGVSVFRRSRRAAAVVAFSLGLGSLVYGTVLSLPASAAAGTAMTGPCVESVPSSVSASLAGSTEPTSNVADNATVTATATASSADPSGSGGSAGASASATTSAAAPSSTTASATPSATDCPPSSVSASASSPSTPVRTTTSAAPQPSKSVTSTAPAKGGPTALPPKSTGTATIPVYVVPPTGSYFIYTDVPPGNASYQLPHGAISRAQMMARAQLWVQDQVPYSQTEWFTDANGTYRQDCSGYVSMAWDLDQNTDFWTGNLNLVSHTIPAAQLLPGDILLSDEHTILFAGWADAGHTTFDYYEESHPDTVAHFVTDAPLGAFLDNGFAPFRYDGVTDSGTLPPNPAGQPYAVLAQQGSEINPAGVVPGWLRGLSSAAPSDASAAASASSNRILAQAAADDVSDSSSRTDGMALGVGGAFLIGAGLLMRRPALQAHKRRH